MIIDTDKLQKEIRAFEYDECEKIDRDRNDRTAIKSFEFAEKRAIERQEIIGDFLSLCEQFPGCIEFACGGEFNPHAAIWPKTANKKGA